MEILNQIAWVLVLAGLAGAVAGWCLKRPGLCRLGALLLALGMASDAVYDLHRASWWVVADAVMFGYNAWLVVDFNRLQDREQAAQ